MDNHFCVWLPFCPFDFTGGMDVRDVSRNEALELGVLKVDHSIQPVALLASDEFQERLAAKLNESFAKFQVDEERRLSDPLNFGNGNDLLRLAEEKNRGLRLLIAQNRFGRL